MIINHNLLHLVGTSRHFHIWCTVTHTCTSNLSLVNTMNKLSLIKSINNLTHMKSINNFSQWKYTQTFPNNHHKKSCRGGRKVVIVPNHLGWLSYGRFISWRVFVHLFEDWIQVWMLCPGFLDLPKVGHQGVIKMIKTHFRVLGSIFVRCSVLLLLIKTVRCSVLLLLIKTARCSVLLLLIKTVRCSFLLLLIKLFVVAFCFYW